MESNLYYEALLTLHDSFLLAELNSFRYEKSYIKFTKNKIEINSVTIYVHEHAHVYNNEYIYTFLRFIAAWQKN